MGLLWWVFDSAPPESRRARLDRRARAHGQRQLERGWRRPSFIGFAAAQLVVLLLLIWIALR